MPYDYSWITERLTVGSQINSSDDVHELIRAGITHILDVGSVDDRIEVKGTNIALLFNPTDDDGNIKKANWFGPSLDFTTGALAHPGHICHLHCQAGVNRAPSTCYAVMRALGWTSDIVLALIRVRRPITIGGIRYWQDAENALRQLRWTRE